MLGRRIGAGAHRHRASSSCCSLLVGGDLGNEVAAALALGRHASARSTALVFICLMFALLLRSPRRVWAQTLGKRVLTCASSRVDGTQGRRRPDRRAQRSLRIVDWLPVLYIVGADRGASRPASARQRLGDLAAKTRVVAADAPPGRSSRRHRRRSDDDVLAQIMR